MNNHSNNLSDNHASKVVLITGAAGGIGRATVNLFAESGWSVIGVDRAPFGDGFPKNGLFIEADISQPQDLEDIFSQAQGFSERLDALVNNAAVQIAKPLLETSVEEWDAVIFHYLRLLGVERLSMYPLCMLWLHRPILLPMRPAKAACWL
jgi:NAD(P)-dependent dehydrogenase (short-subunit alcohol dehydrogenase family)